jgi:hypothetical protein
MNRPGLIGIPKPETRNLKLETPSGKLPPPVDWEFPRTVGKKRRELSPVRGKRGAGELTGSGLEERKFSPH